MHKPEAKSPLPTTSQDMQAAASSSLIPPSTYLLKWDGRHVRFFMDALTEKTDIATLPLVTDDPPSYSSDTKEAQDDVQHSEDIEPHIKPEEAKSDFYLQCSMKAYMLFAGSDNVDQTRRLIDVKPEGRCKNFS